MKKRNPAKRPWNYHHTVVLRSFPIPLNRPMEQKRVLLQGFMVISGFQSITPRSLRYLPEFGIVHIGEPLEDTMKSLRIFQCNRGSHTFLLQTLPWSTIADDHGASAQ